ncbi:MAG: hypothetical protein ACLQVX_06645 [Limisphaerales bacterium]
MNCDNGHFTEEKTVTFKNFADRFALLLWQTGHGDFQPVDQAIVLRNAHCRPV